ncbi:proline racemase family protein [Mesorhizobium sp. VK23B]|uniref:4-hydroxyproline epimerase n=1 Tax=Mesorhizobium dulcispinae TaxID=3072316 RepID=A0ABU4XMU5_9HYPH|nr:MULTISPECIES: proline racemase family protein [unclassified Mesorhizobium]MDX8469728.1 proline racemase family protein [Mesorhizobium sp. VK23B]MDX8476067.1 proline racemase family protein [Mesorhizobium sp. VK23A]
MRTNRIFTVVDSHTAGHPTRTVTSGIPPLRGTSAREQMDDFRDNHDNLRSLLLHEPRGHAAMCAAIPVPSHVADQGLFFIFSYYYADMCGHATIGYIATLAALGALPLGFEQNGMSIETPAGIIHVAGKFEADRLTSVILRNVPCYLAASDVSLEAEGLGQIACDIAYGGLTYAIVDASQVDLPFDVSHASRWCRAGMAIKEALNASSAGLQVNSVLFYSPIEGGSRHLVILADNKFDRSPCGTGTSARLAQLHARGELTLGAPYRAENILGVPFAAKVVELAQGPDGQPAVIPEVRGMAHVSAFSTLVLEADDPLPAGFLPK